MDQLNEQANDVAAAGWPFIFDESIDGSDALRRGHADSAREMVKDGTGRMAFDPRAGPESDEPGLLEACQRRA